MDVFFYKNLPRKCSQGTWYQVYLEFHLSPWMLNKHSMISELYGNSCRKFSRFCFHQL